MRQIPPLPCLILVLFIFFLSSLNFIAQDGPQVIEMAIFIGKGDFGESIKFHLDAQGTIWTAENITTNYAHEDEIVPNDTIMSGYLYWKNGWSLYIQGYYNPIAYSIYKLSIDPIYGYPQYIYIDTRDFRWGNGILPGYNPDFFIFCDQQGYENCQFYYRTLETDWVSIANGEIINVWDIHNESRSTTCFVDFNLHNYSLSLTAYNSRPKLNWIQHPVAPNNYKIYRCITASPKPVIYSLIATVSSSTNSYIDYDFTIGGNDLKAYYYIKADINPNAQPTTNFVSTYVQYYKRNENDDSFEQSKGSLSIFPNPFNPNANIQYYLEKPSNLEITLYNYLGEKIKTLVKKYHESGEYNIELDGSKYNSGVYFVILNKEKEHLVRKIILLK